MSNSKDGRKSVTRYPCPPPAVGTPRASIDIRGIVATTFHPGKDVWWIVWHDPPCLITVTDKVVREVTEYPDGRAAFARYMELSERAKP